jgi:hypothetical protein
VPPYGRPQPCGEQKDQKLHIHALAIRSVIWRPTHVHSEVLLEAPDTAEDPGVLGVVLYEVPEVLVELLTVFERLLRA